MIRKLLSGQPRQNPDWGREASVREKGDCRDQSGRLPEPNRKAKALLPQADSVGRKERVCSATPDAAGQRFQGLTSRAR